MAEAITRTQVLNASCGVLTDAKLTRLLKEAQQSQLLAGKPEPLVLKAIMSAVDNHRNGVNLMSEPQSIAAVADKSAIWDRKVTPEMLGGKAPKAEAFSLEVGHVENAFRGHKAEAILAAPSVTKVHIPASSRKIIDEQFKSLPGVTEPAARIPAWKKMSASDQITTGICLLTAASFILSGAARAQSAFAKDEEGNRKINATSLTIAMGEMAAGIAAGIFGAHIYRSASR
ncbi:MAG: hypothetical protein ACKVOE_04000 [Rickettsiales bacterium]